MHRLLALTLLFAAPAVRAEPLSLADREVLLEKLAKLHDSAREKAMGRIGSAIAAFRTGMASDDAAAELYLKCVEKVEFEDRRRSSQEFREWKRHQDDRLKDPGLRRCLRHQLRWLVLSLEAAEAGDNRDALAPKAVEALDAIFGNPDQFEGNVDPLREPVTSTVFARAYNLGGAKLKNWPLSPLDIGEVFDLVIFPPLIKDGKFDALRDQWLKRVRYETTVREAWTGDPGKKNERSLEYEKFIAETLPDLKWQMEESLYAAGDERRAAANMLAHLEENLTHPKAREWGERFLKQIEPPATPPAEPAEP
jgi:hypothetical protein